VITLPACHAASDRRGGTSTDQALAAVAAYQRSRRAYAYGELLNADGSCNVAAFHWILARRIAADINIALRGAGGLVCPRSIPFSATTEWRAKAAATVDAALVSPAERERIAEHHGAEMLELVAAMQRAAKRDREQLTPRQFHIAAE